MRLRTKGLTLVELILVIVVLGIIAGVLYSKVLNKGVGTAKASASAAALENIIDGINQYFATNMCTDPETLSTGTTDSCFTGDPLQDLCEAGFLKCEDNGGTYVYKLPMGKTISIESDPNYGIILTIPENPATTASEKEQMTTFCKAAFKTWGDMKFIKICKASGGEAQFSDCNDITQMKIVIMPATIAADPACP